LARCFLSDILQQARFYFVIYEKKCNTHQSLLAEFLECINDSIHIAQNIKISKE
jgi:hypothetical protein